jgi:hypothetical protein
MKKKLKLNKETLRTLKDRQLDGVAIGRRPTQGPSCYEECTKVVVDPN